MTATPRPGTPGKEAQRHMATFNEHARLRASKVLADMPDPLEQVYHLNEREIHALRTAWQTREGWRVEAQYAAELARDGMCEMRGPFLTAWGLAVRHAALREDS